jgi:radial spoke head protein 9
VKQGNLFSGVAPSAPPSCLAHPLSPSRSLVSLSPSVPQAGLAYSLPLKKAESGLEHLNLWGRVTALNGRDYLVAQGFNKGFRYQGQLHLESKFFYSQDGATWVDLPALTPEAAAKAAKVTGMLAGDPSKVYTYEEPAPAPEGGEAAAAAAGEEGGEPGEPGKVTVEVRELQRLALAVQSITADTWVVPKGAFLENSSNNVVLNRLFEGVPHPGKLESYQHFAHGPEGATLAQDVRGSWALQYDAFQGVASLRSLVWPGYAFFYDGRSGTYGGLYQGTGEKNHDLVFML